ncbi:MAG TPA: phosphatase PAP2 family protein [Gemmatimonadales bacterium]|nr:phosphatase PAP2 family protein [Gemmatimonadales bacterium]
MVVVGLGLAWRWFEKHRAALVEHTQLAWRRIVRTPALRRFRRRYPRLWRFMARRFARGEYLGFHLTIGLAVSLVGLWLFGAITEDVVNRDSLTRFDVTVLEWLHAHATPAGVAVFAAISRLGSPVTMTVLAVAVSLLLASRRAWIVLGGWVAAFAGAGLLDQWLKFVIRRPRPAYAAALLHNRTWSFPSGHAMGALVGYGMLAYVLLILWKESRRTQLEIIAVTTLLIAAIGVSRLYLGVHYFSDVIGGYAAGMLWLSTCISGVEVARRWQAGNSSTTS